MQRFLSDATWAVKEAEDKERAKKVIDEYSRLFKRYYGKKCPPCIKLEDIPESITYIEDSSLPYMASFKAPANIDINNRRGTDNINNNDRRGLSGTFSERKIPDLQPGFPRYQDMHIGQRKLALHEVQALTMAVIDGVVNVCIYAGSAPNNKGAFLASLFPNVVFVFIDPAKFDIKKEAKYGVTSKIFQTRDVDPAMTPDRCKEVCDAILADDSNIRIINDFMTIDLAKAFNAAFAGTNIIFISDIRTNLAVYEGVDEHTGIGVPAAYDDQRMQKKAKEIMPDAADILWNHAQMYCWIHHLKPTYSVLKWRFPFYKEDPEIFIKLAGEEPRRADFEEAKRLGVDFVKDFKNKTLHYYEGSTYLQTFCGGNSTESRLHIVGIPKIVSYGIADDYDNKYFFYNKIYRWATLHDNPYAEQSVGFDCCNDCAIEAQIWKDYIARFNPQADVIGYVSELTQITNRNLFRAGHGKMMKYPPSFDELNRMITAIKLAIKET